MRFWNAIWLTLVAGACGFDPDPYREVTAPSALFSYDLNAASCSTGYHAFSSEKTYCLGLKNEALNNSCAREQRERLFQEKCG